MRFFTLAMVLVALALPGPAAAAEQSSEANRLFVEAARLVAQAGAGSDLQARAEALARAEANLDRIVARHPESYLAVMLITGQQVGTLSLPLLRSEAARARLELAAAAQAEEAPGVAALEAELKKLNTAFSFLRNENDTLYQALDKKEAEVAALLQEQAQTKELTLARLAALQEEQRISAERVAVLETENATLSETLGEERNRIWDLERRLWAMSAANDNSATAAESTPSTGSASVAAVAPSTAAPSSGVAGTPVPTPRPASIEAAAAAAEAVQPAAATGETVAATPTPAPAPAATYETATAPEPSPTETQQAALPADPEQDQPQITAEEIAAAVKEALQVGTERVVSQVGQVDGFNADPQIHIPLPQDLATVGEALSVIGLGGLTEDLELRLNRAAETAAPQAQGLFLQAIADMRVEDIQGIFQGGDDAATQYFKGAMSGPLAESMRPVIDDSLAQAGAVQAYDELIGKYKSIPLVPDVKADLTEHVLVRALDGLFYYLGQEEAAIRNDALKRTTELLQRVFGRS